MSCIVQGLRSGLACAAASALALALAGCSGESTRFNDNPFSSAPSSPEATGSIQTPQTAPVRRVESRPLPQAGQAAPYPGTGVAGGGRGMASYTPSQTYAPPPSSAAAAPQETTGGVAKPAPSGHWTWDGGTPVTVNAGDTVETIAHRYGVPASAIMQANNLTASGNIHAGQQLVIPRYTRESRAAAQASRAPVASAPRTAPAAVTPAGNGAVHVVAPGDTLSKISRLYHKPVSEIVKANNITITTRLNVGDRITIPGVKSSVPNRNNKVSEADPPPPATPAQAAEPPAESASVIMPAIPAAGAEASKAVGETSSLPKFRWPANGRVISAFGPMTNGQQNDGINIAVPENTPVKAAEDGTVAYAGNELKGYGNLILVRHPNGYVTAYAHAKELLVKRGDQVKRGQVIAHSGQSGNVNAPQLHFEIRKGSAPVDPTKFLNGA
ncbi:MAG TPA: LysM peptidoglycan-binding domain-containing M23 family metallopeptidase [Xanthobacteraceae bacterium]|jgi:murein DD-endopeptidase MepM/ murein hydrolase activator NlpD